MITFALHCGNSSEESIQYKDLDPTGQQLYNASMVLKVTSMNINMSASIQTIPSRSCKQRLDLLFGDKRLII